MSLRRGGPRSSSRAGVSHSSTRGSGVSRSSTRGSGVTRSSTRGSGVTHSSTRGSGAPAPGSASPLQHPRPRRPPLQHPRPRRPPRQHPRLRLPPRQHPRLQSCRVQLQPRPRRQPKPRRSPRTTFPRKGYPTKEPGRPLTRRGRSSISSYFRTAKRSAIGQRDLPGPEVNAATGEMTDTASPSSTATAAQMSSNPRKTASFTEGFRPAHRWIPSRSFKRTPSGSKTIARR